MDRQSPQRGLGRVITRRVGLYEPGRLRPEAILTDPECRRGVYLALLVRRRRLLPVPESHAVPPDRTGGRVSVILDGIRAHLKNIAAPRDTADPFQRTENYIAQTMI